MRHRSFLETSLILLAIAVTLPHFSVAQPSATETKAMNSKIQIPKSIQAEHEAIHAALVEATKAPGRVGTAAKDLAEVLHPHFVREEQIALPPLGLLAPLATGDYLPQSTLSEALAMTDSLKSELPRMLEEHKKIRAAVDKLRQAARAEHATKSEQLAEQLALHAQTEEEVLYPAAVLVGDIIRARLQSK
jgi:iron-sulfur cluster repair protein YtfE (RIC family)